MTYKIVAVGDEDFTIGFKLAGVKVVNTNISQDKVNTQKSIGFSDPKDVFEKYLNEKDVGIIVTDENTINRLDEALKERVEESVQPVTVVLSLESGQENLQKMIKKSLGVDLWKGEK